MALWPGFPASIFPTSPSMWFSAAIIASDVFLDEADFVRYRQELAEAAWRHGCAVHAYVLMSNHVHLLVTPHVAGAVSRMMQSLGRRYVGGFNHRHARTGTL
jgi:putative transposase